MLESNDVVVSLNDCNSIDYSESTQSSVNDVNVNILTEGNTYLQWQPAVNFLQNPKPYGIFFQPHEGRRYELGDHVWLAHVYDNDRYEYPILIKAEPIYYIDGASCIWGNWTREFSPSDWREYTAYGFWKIGETISKTGRFQLLPTIGYSDQHLEEVLLAQGYPELLEPLKKVHAYIKSEVPAWKS